MAGWKQMALDLCDARCCDRLAAYRRALLALRQAVDEALAELDRPPEAEAEPPPATTPERDFWQREADRRGEALLVLTRRSGLHGIESCLLYAVAQEGATSWERANADRVMVPSIGVRS